jgi:hypothetical protein
MTIQEFLVSIGFAVDESTIAKVQSKMDNLGTRLNHIGNQMSLYVSAPLAGLAAYAIKSAAEMEQMHVSFEVFLGSAEKAKALMDDLIQLSVKTPFTMQGLTKTSNMLLGMNVRGEDLIETLKMLGDASRGNQEILNRLAYAYGQVNQARVLKGSELRQFTEAGVGLVSELSRITGIPEEKLATSVGRYKITIGQVTQALKNMTSEGGKYYQLTEKQAATLMGIFSNLKDILFYFGSSFGTQIVKALDLNNALRKLVKLLDTLRKKFEELDISQVKLILGFATFLVAIGPLMKFLSFLVRSGTFIVFILRSMAVAFTAANLPATLLAIKMALIPGLVAAALGALYLLIDDFIVWTKGGESLLGDWLGSFEDVKNKLKPWLDGIKSIFGLVEMDFKTFMETIKTVALETFTEIADNLRLLFEPIFGPLFSIVEGVASFAGNVHGTVQTTTFWDNLSKLMPGSTTGSLPTSFLNTSNKEVKIENNITVQMPAGTTKQQADYAEAAMKKVAKEYLLSETRNVVQSNKGSD